MRAGARGFAPSGGSLRLPSCARGALNAHSSAPGRATADARGSSSAPVALPWAYIKKYRRRGDRGPRSLSVRFGLIGSAFTIKFYLQMRCDSGQPPLSSPSATTSSSANPFQTRCRIYTSNRTRGRGALDAAIHATEPPPPYIDRGQTDPDPARLTLSGLAVHTPADLKPAEVRRAIRRARRRASQGQSPQRRDTAEARPRQYSTV